MKTSPAVPRLILCAGLLAGALFFAPAVAAQQLAEQADDSATCDTPDVKLIDSFGIEWCWNAVYHDGATGPGGADETMQPPMQCAEDGMADVPLSSGVVRNGLYPESITSGVVCRKERKFQGEIVNLAPDGCFFLTDSITFEGAREGMLAYGGTWMSYCGNKVLMSGEWNGTFDHKMRAPHVDNLAKTPFLGPRGLRRAERANARAERIRKGDLEVPATIALEQNYPNPFNPSTQIRFTLNEASNVSLRVYDLLGQEVAVLASGRMEAGRHDVQFDASHLTAGVYLYMLQAGDFTATKRLTLLK